MKKLISLLLVLTMVFCVTACSSETEKTTETAETTETDVAEESILDPYDPEISDETAAALGEIEDETASDEQEADESETADAADDSDFDWDTGIAAYDREISTETTGSLDIEWEDVDLTYTPGEITYMEPIEIDPVIVEIDPYEFDVEEFKAESIDNIDETDMDYFATLDAEAALEIAELRVSLLADLTLAFENAGLPVQVDEATGEIALDSAILFGVDSSDVSDNGKAVLQRFVYVYSSVILNDKYDGFVSEILVEGHTDTSASYDYNLTLSQERADNVKAFCLSADCGLDEDSRDALSELMTTVGCSYDRPVYDENGDVDMDASRRVTFRFLINLD